MYYLWSLAEFVVSMICAIQSQNQRDHGTGRRGYRTVNDPIQLMDEMMNKYKSWAPICDTDPPGRFDELTTVGCIFRNMDERLEFYLKRTQVSAAKNS